MRTWVFALAAAVLFLVSMPFAVAQTCTPPASGDWLVNETIVCSSETLVLNGSLLIDPLGNLTLENSLVSINSSYDGAYGIEVNGSLTVSGSTIRNASAAYAFVANVGASLAVRDSFIYGCGFASSDNKKKGVYVKSAGSNITNTTFSRNYYALLAYSSGNSITDNIISSNYAGLEIEGSNNHVSGNSFSDNAGGSVTSVTGEGIIFEHNSLLNVAGGSAVVAAFIVNSSLINDNTFFNNTGGGFVLGGRSNNITANRIEANGGNYGLQVAESENTRITGNVIIQNAGYGLYLYMTRTTIAMNNLMSGNGIYDLYMHSAADTTFTNTSYTYSIRKWRLNARVVDNASVAVYGAQAVVRSALSGQVYSGTTNAQGNMSAQTLDERIENASGIFIFSPYSLNVSSSGYAGNYTEFSLTSDVSLVLTLTPVAAPPQNLTNVTFAFVIELPKNATYIRQNLTSGVLLPLLVNSTGNISSCNYSSGNLTGVLSSVSAGVFNGSLNVSGIEGARSVDITCLSTGGVANTSRAFFTVYPTHDCQIPGDCAATQVCVSWQCENLVCTCGYAQNHECVSYDCCADSDCSDNQVCSPSHACAPVNCGCPEKISGHRCNMEIGYCCSDLQCDINYTCSNNACIQRMLSVLAPTSLSVGGKYSVTVTDQNGNPVAGARIDVKYLDASPFVEDRYETAENGSATVEIKYAGRVDFVARKEGYFTDSSLAEVPEPFNLFLVLEIIMLVAAIAGAGFTAMVLLKHRKGGGSGSIYIGFRKGPLRLDKTVSGPRVMLKIKNNTKKKLLDITVRDSVPRGAFIHCNLPPKIEPLDPANQTLTWEILELEPEEEVDIVYETRAANRGFAVKYNNKEYSG